MPYNSFHQQKGQACVEEIDAPHFGHLIISEGMSDDQ